MPTQVTTVHVFVSSTWLDLQPERQAVEAALQQMRETKFVGMEYFGSRDESTYHASLDEVDHSEVYVGIFGGRYGSGITEAEYRRARDRSLPCFIYFQDEGYIPVAGCETEPGQVARLAALKAELRSAHTVTLFTTPDSLAAKITADLHRWLFDEYLAPRLERAVRQGDQTEIRRLTDATCDQEALRQVLAQRGITVGGDVANSLLVLGNRNVINFFVQGITSLPTD